MNQIGRQRATYQFMFNLSYVHIIMIKDIYLIRHGETQYNAESKSQGSEVDIPLNDNGKEQATKTGRYLQKHNNIDLIISSPRCRTKMTAEIIAKEINYPVSEIKYDDNLIERKKGIISGTTNHDRKTDKRYSKFIAAQKKFNSIVDPIARAESDIMEKAMIKMGFESTNELTMRIDDFIATLKKSKHNNIIVVSHTGFLTNLIRDLCHLGQFGILIPSGKLIGNESNCTIAYVTYNEGEFVLRTAPTNVHLAFIQI